MKNKVMKIQILIIVILLLGTLPVLGEKDPDEVRIKLNFKQGPWEDIDGYGYNDGRWHANGAFTDSGTVHDDYQMLYDLEPFPGMRSYYTMTGKSGVLYIEVELGSFEWINPWTIQFEGTWTVDEGEGEYSSVSGSGTATQTIVLAAAMNSGEYMVGGPATSNHVVLEGEFYFPP
jgi:hypothetical protein